MDFATFRHPWGRRHAQVVVLCYSQLLWQRCGGRHRFASGGSEGSAPHGRAFWDVPCQKVLDGLRGGRITWQECRAWG